MTTSPSLRERLIYYFFELMVIVIGISISFVLNEWRQDRDGREALRRELAALEVNLQADRAELASLIERRKPIQPAMRRLLQLLDAEAPAGRAHDELFSQMFEGAGFCFYPDTGAWKALVASGNLRWIDNRALLAALFEFYDHTVPRIDDNNKLADEVMVTGMLAWMAAEFPATEDGKAFAGPIILTKRNTVRVRAEIGRALPHTSWYETLLDMTLEQLDQALEVVRAELARP